MQVLNSRNYRYNWPKATEHNFIKKFILGVKINRKANNINKLYKYTIIIF